jgi:hypothetical protein
MLSAATRNDSVVAVHWSTGSVFYRICVIPAVLAAWGGTDHRT